MVDIHLDLFSESLRMHTGVNVCIPKAGNVGEIGVKAANVTDKKLKCLYLLHGLSDDHTIWMRRTSIERYAEQYGICVVMPSGGRSFYSDMKDSSKYYTYIAKELPQIIESIFNVSPKREDRFIGGNSMGGYGAIKIALKEQGRYAAAFGLSSVADIGNENFTQTLVPVFGGTIPDSADLFYLASEHNNDDIKPDIYMTVGKQDYMYEDNVRLSKHFEGLNYNYKYLETEGGHSWELWDKLMPEVMSWLFASDGK